MTETSPKFVVRLHQGGFDYAYLREMFRAADRLGDDGASLYDLLGIPTLECWTTLSALAAETERIRLIPMVLANLYRHPGTLAKMAATLDVISGGRLVLGIGAGGGEGDHKAYGLPYPSTRERVAMMGEAVEVIRLLWSGERVSFEGNYYRLDNALCDPAPVQRPGPPILIGGSGERHLLRAAAQYADITNMRADMSIGEHGAKRSVLDAHCAAVGREPSEIALSHNAHVFIGEDKAAVERVMAEHAGRHGVSVEGFRASLGNAIVGTPAQCVEQLRRYVDYGIGWFFLLFPEPVSVGDLDLFAKEVLPAFRSG
ncbi:MAG: LLM class flavin-dependent oxidoreductase [Chloroflexi bacterium]|nr:LLM class flavin-dependent oxidoreductase [Chloroflexota bacterium]